MKPKLTLETLIKEAKAFCERESNFGNKELFGVTDGKAVGTFIEHKFTDYLEKNYDVFIGSSANGIDMPSDDIIAYLTDRNLPADEITMRDLAEEILRNKPVQGYLTISNALQWRLQYGRIVKLTESVEGIIRIVNKT
jgi:hypothetical protein